MLIVQKYGGSSLCDAEKIRTAARRATALWREGHEIVMVVSAQGDTTDEMIARAASLDRHASAREMDAFLSAGEQMSAALMAMALGTCGADAVSLTGAQAGIYTDSTYRNARITHIDTTRIRSLLAERKIAVVAGFQGCDQGGNITTLGRGGSDTTAVALAAYLHADRCQIFTDVDGVYDRDPRRFPDAVRYSRIGYDDMLALVARGAQVLHDQSVLLARAHGITIEVLSAETATAGTLVGECDQLSRSTSAPAARSAYFEAR